MMRNVALIILVLLVFPCMVLAQAYTPETKPVPVAPRGAKLVEWAKEQTIALGKLSSMYESVFSAKDVATSITASSRIGRRSDDVVRAILASGTKQAECEMLEQTAEPFRQGAISGYSDCLTKAADTGWFDDYARGCEAALVRIVPDQVAPFRELHAAPMMSAPIAVVTGP